VLLRYWKNEISTGEMLDALAAGTEPPLAGFEPSSPPGR
jgi:hypothetical protein